MRSYFLPHLAPVLFAFLSLGLLPCPASAATLGVPSQYATIQAAVNAAQNGDTILIADGTYTGPGNVDIDFGGKNLTVTSQNGAASTIIDCGGSANASHRGFYLHSGETNVVISGFTIENGYEGVFYGGGAIYNAINGSTIQKCTFKNNTSGSGGAIYTTIDVGTETIDSCVFSGNSAPNGGGGIFCQSSSNAALAVVNCVLIGNSTSYDGGGIYNYNSDSSRASVTNCTFTGNTATSGGSALYTGNAASSYGSGTTSLINSIFWGDTSDELIGGFNYVSNCDIQSQPNPYIGSGTTVAYNISSDPLFFSAPSDLHLQAISPCRGAGIGAGAPPVTIDGVPRPSPPSMGAYEAEVTGTAATTTTLTSSLNPSAPRQSVTLTATVSGGVSPTGSVAFVEAGAPPVRVALTNGKALYTTSVLAGGQHVIKAGYSGDTKSAASISPALTQVVSFNSTSTTLKSSPSPAAYGQPVTLTATVAGTAPSGTVTFTDVVSNGFTFTYAAAVSNGVATYTSSTLMVGSHQITASYGGDSYTSSSTSAAVTQIVTLAPTTTTVSSSLNPSIATQDITFTATIATTPPNAATGAVSFAVDGVFMAGPNIGSGPVTFDTSTLTTGTHKIVASYSGDSNFSASTSSAFIQVVNPHITPLYVSPTGNDGNPGTLASPKLTLQAAMNTAFTGDTVVAEDGTYTGPGDVDLDFGGKNISVTSQNGAATTIIDCGGSANASHRGFYLHSGETSAVIGGFTIQNGNSTAGGSSSFYGGGIYASFVGLTVQSCIFKNDAAGQGGGIYLAGYRSPFSLINCVFTGNSASSGAAIYNYTDGGAGSLALTNCTITGSTAGTLPYSTSPGCAIYINGGYQTAPPAGGATLTNDIVYGDTGGEIGGTASTATYCDIQGDYPGTGNINADPLFADYPSDLHLRYGSPCLGAGTASGAPATAIDGVTRPNPPSIGAYEAYLAPTMVVVGNVSGTAGQTVALSAALGNPGAAGLSGRTLSFSVDGTAVGTAVTNSAGTATLPYAIPSIMAFGGHALSVSFAGDMTNGASSGIGTLTVSAAPIVSMVQINAGGKAATPFSADTDFSGGSTYSVSAAISTSGVTSPAPQAVYQTERYGNFTYTLPNLTPGASYTLRLHFAETYWTSAGKRLFSVSVNGSPALTSFDIFAAAGGINRAVVKTFPVTADGSGKITVTFISLKDNAKVSGLELLPPVVPAAPAALSAAAGNAQVTLSWTASSGATSYNVYRSTTPGTETLLKSGLTSTGYTDTGLTNGTTYFYQVAAVNSAGTSAASVEASATPTAPPLSAVYQINSGGKAAAPFIADTDFSGGSTYSVSAAVSTSGVTSPAPQAVYQTERYGNFTYTLPNLTPGASYTLRLHFAETYWTSTGKRLFSVKANGAALLTSFDIFAVAGGINKAVVETFPVTADAGGKVTLTFISIKDNAKISGLELLH